ncbi:Uncharacterised protein [Mycobacteroides abscessus]|nr:Uncharacterised protein [Mycobacteroides abscessus]
MSGSVSSPCGQVSGNCDVSTCSASGTSCSSVKVRRSGSRRCAVFHQRSKCAADTTSSGTRSS